MRKSYEKSFSLRVFFFSFFHSVHGVLLLVVSCDSLWFCRCMHGDSSIRMSTVEYAYSDRRQIRCASQFCHHTKPNMNMKSQKKRRRRRNNTKNWNTVFAFQCVCRKYALGFFCVLCVDILAHGHRCLRIRTQNRLTLAQFTSLSIWKWRWCACLGAHSSVIRSPKSSWHIDVGLNHIDSQSNRGKTKTQSTPMKNQLIWNKYLENFILCSNKTQYSSQNCIFSLFLINQCTVGSTPYHFYNRNRCEWSSKTFSLFTKICSWNVRMDIICANAWFHFTHSECLPVQVFFLVIISLRFFFFSHRFGH